LRGDQRDEQAEEQRRSGQITPIERHRHGIAAGFAERRRGDLDDPEPEGDGRYLAHRRMAVHDQTLCVILPGQHRDKWFSRLLSVAATNGLAQSRCAPAGEVRLFR